MKNKIVLLTSVLLLLGCFGDENKTDETLLKRDQKELDESLNAFKVNLYRFAKIAMRSSIVDHADSPELQNFHSKLNRVNNQLMNVVDEDNNSLSAMDYLSLYQDYRAMNTFVQATDEDDFPSLSQVMSYKDQQANGGTYVATSNEEKIIEQNIEHAILSALVLASRDLGKDISLYECSKTRPDLIPDGELKTMMQYFRGFLFFEKGFYYLSEAEITNNINWLNEHPEVDLPIVKGVFRWNGMDNKRAHIGFHSLNHMFRGFDRLMMDRAIDEERALEDFEAFLADSKKLGLENECVWAIETFVYLKQEENEKAIVSLTKLKDSAMLSTKDKKAIDEAIGYLDDRETGKVLNGVYDKYFLSKIAVKYMMSILAEVDWKKIMKKQNIPHQETIFKTIDKTKTFFENMDQYTSGEELKNAGEKLKEKGSDWWNKAKELIDEK